MNHACVPACVSFTVLQSISFWREEVSIFLVKRPSYNKHFIEIYGVILVTWDSNLYLEIALNADGSTFPGLTGAQHVKDACLIYVIPKLTDNSSTLFNTAVVFTDPCLTDAHGDMSAECLALQSAYTVSGNRSHPINHGRWQRQTLFKIYSTLQCYICWLNLWMTLCNNTENSPAFLLHSIATDA